MNSYVITTDTTCDLPDSYIKENNLDIITLFYSMDDVIYGNDKKINPSEFYNMMRNGKMPTTMACNPENTEQCFRKHLDAGKDILHIAFSSALSSSYNTAAVVGRELEEEYKTLPGFIPIETSKCEGVNGSVPSSFLPACTMM